VESRHGQGEIPSANPRDDAALTGLIAQYLVPLGTVEPDVAERRKLSYSTAALNPSGLPFDWIISSGSGVTATIGARPDRDAERALFIEFGHGRVDFQGISQIIMLSPGTYKFQGRYRGDIAGRRGLRWRITCAGATAISIGESPMVVGIVSPWKDFEFSFSVPKDDCRAQYVRLALDARSASEQFVSGSIWYDDLRIVRAE
jgi:hypothetical protein